MSFSYFRFRSVFGLLLLAVCCNGAAQNAAGASLMDAPRACLQYAEFRQEKILEGLPRPLVSRGHILLDCNRGTLWSTRTPINETLVYTFSGKHWLVKADGEVQPIKNTAQKRIGDILARIVRGDREFVDKYFRRQTEGNITQLLPSQRRLKKYIDSITLDETPEGLQITVARTDKQNMRMDISGVGELAQLDAQSCATLLQNEAGCAQLFAADK